jgi:hypothetical protein
MSSLPREGWKLTTNAQYLEAIKVVMNLATASLVLPIMFVKNFSSYERLALAPYRCWAYSSWSFLLLSVACGLGFYWASAKYVKVVSGGREMSWLARTFRHKETLRSANWFEILRDLSALVMVLCFILGLICSLWFFGNL